MHVCMAISREGLETVAFSRISAFLLAISINVGKTSVLVR